MRAISTCVAAVLLVSSAATVSSAEPITFDVIVPHCTPHSRTIYVRSNREAQDVFRHDALTRVGPQRYRGTFELTTPRGQFEYKYSHDLCDATGCPGIEKSVTYTGSGGDIPPRTLTDTATSVADRVFIWRSALKSADGSIRPPDEAVAFCGPFLTVGHSDGRLMLSYDAYDGDTIEIELGTDTSYGMQLPGENGHRNHVMLPTLQPGLTYHYRVVENGVPGPDHTFVAPPDAQSHVRFAVIGDTQYYVEENRVMHEQVAAQVLDYDPQLILSAGDMVASDPGNLGPGGWNFPEMGRWNVFFGVMAPLLARTPFVAAMGNHEEDAPYFWDIFPFPETDAPKMDHFDFKFGHVHVTVLYTGTTGGYDREAILDSQTPWLISTLEAANRDPEVRWKVVVLHRGAFSQGANHPTDGQGFHDSSRNDRPSWGSVFQQHGVDVVFAGHNHNFTYAMHQGVRYVTQCSGAPVHGLRSPQNPTTLYAESACSAGFVEASPDRLAFSAVRPDGSDIDDGAFALCNGSAGCAGLPHNCPQAVNWSCVQKTCESTCVEYPDHVVEPTSLTFDGTTPAPQTVRISQPSGASLTWTAACMQPWLQCTPTSGSTPAEVTVSVVDTGLGPGTHEGALIVGTTTVAVTWTIPDGPPANLPPTAPRLVAPIDNAIVGTTPTLQLAAATDPDGDDSAIVYTFEVRRNNAVVVSQQSPNTSWTVAPALNDGTVYTWRARATDVIGAEGPWSGEASFRTPARSGGPDDRNPACQGDECKESCGCRVTQPSNPTSLVGGFVLCVLLALRRRR